jgi:hypothetical protein
MAEITVALVGGSEFDRQRSVEVVVRVQAAGVLILRYGLALHCRVMYREFDQSPTLVREGMYDRQCCCRPDVPDYAFVLVFNAWMGTEPRRVSCPFRSRWAVLDNGRGPARGCIVVAGRGHHRNKGTSTRSMIVRNSRQPGCH